MSMSLLGSRFRPEEARMAFNVYYCCDKCGVTVSWVNCSVSMAIATAIARKEGWQVGKRGWFCPNCRDRKRKSTPPDIRHAAKSRNG